MSIEHVAVVLHHSKAKGTTKLVLLGIANHQGDGGAWPAVSTLARYANTSERSVQRALEWLAGHGELVIARQEGGTPGMPDHRRPNRYDVIVSCPSWCDKSPQHRDMRDPQRGMFGVIHRGDASVTRARRGVTPVSPHPVTPVSPEPSLEPTTHPVVPTSLDTRACADCSQPELVCLSRQRRLRPEDRHTYRPRDHGDG